ncbi:MAG: hypothetical protein V3U57_03435 [Robiginitomaculum sp.]
MENVFISDVGQTFYGWEHVSRNKEQGGNVYIEVKIEALVVVGNLLIILIPVFKSKACPWV